MSTASGVSWAACPPGPRAWPSDGWQEWPPPVGGGQAAASGPLPSRAPARLYREGHTEGHSPGRGRKKPPGWVWAIKGHCFVLQGEQRPGTSMSCPPDLCSLASSRAYLPRCPCLPVFCHQFTASVPLPGLLPVPFALTPAPTSRLTPGIFTFQHPSGSEAPPLVPPQHPVSPPGR